MTLTLDQRPRHTLPPPSRTRSAPGRSTARTAPDTTTDTTIGTATRPGWERNSDRRDRLHLGLSELFRTRGDLDGVSAVADVLAEDLLWSA